MGVFFNKLMYLINLLMAFLLLLSWGLPFLPPSRFPTIALLSLVVPLLIIINIFFLAFWALQLHRRFFLSFLVLLISYFYFNPFYNISAKGDSSTYGQTLRVMSYNVRLFNTYEPRSAGNGADVMKTYIKNTNPDILCIQEYYRPNKVDFSSFPYKYIHFKNRKMKLGNAIFSKYPLVNTGAFDFKDSSNNTLYADVVKGKDTIRIYSTHLQSIGILPEVKFLQENDNRRLRRKMSTAFEKQQFQINTILNHKQQTKHPVIICGDFNNTPFSYSYRKIKGNMQDTFRERGNGLGTTFLFDSFPLRIDYILASHHFDVVHYETLPNTFSDHHAIWTTLGWGSKN